MKSPFKIHKRIRRSAGQRKNRWGATAIEFAMVCPMFMIVIAYCTECARLSMMRNLAQNAAYEATRYIITDGSTIGEGIERAESILSRLGTVGADITINNSDGAEDNDGNVPNEIVFGTDSVTCRIEFFLKDNSMIIPDFVVGDTKIVSQITLRTERYRGYYDGVSTN